MNNDTDKKVVVMIDGRYHPMYFGVDKYLRHSWFADIQRAHVFDSVSSARMSCEINDLRRDDVLFVTLEVLDISEIEEA